MYVAVGSLLRGRFVKNTSHLDFHLVSRFLRDDELSSLAVRNFFLVEGSCFSLGKFQSSAFLENWMLRHLPRGTRPHISNHPSCHLLRDYIYIYIYIHLTLDISSDSEKKFPFSLLSLVTFFFSFSLRRFSAYLSYGVSASARRSR